MGVGLDFTKVCQIFTENMYVTKLKNDTVTLDQKVLLQCATKLFNLKYSVDLKKKV